jgi:hypothetical protein
MISSARARVIGAMSWTETTSDSRSGSAESSKIEESDVAVAPVTPDFRSQ